MKTIVALVWLAGSALVAHATQATITAYRFVDISFEAMRKLTAEECQARYPQLWTFTCDLPLKQEVKASQTTNAHSATVQLYAEPDAQEPTKTSVKCQVDDEIKRAVTANSILRLQTRMSLPSGKPVILFGAFSNSGKVGETKSEALLYVMQLDEKKR
ncbi:MAG: hypothetical protein HYV95_16290 [Opitutae bacterium]|nr:hypothetical protein [Opitutae bacterium]